ncbi:hypothetical protein IFO70_05070 [Phormidium tenue FACHB-886]|nr:hypothetical protein [Phormidium tenue FACHB-886]
MLHQAIAQPAAASTIDQTALMKERREPMQHPSSKKLPRQPLPHRIWQISGGDRFILTLVGSAIMLVLAANAAAAQSI